MSATRKRLQGFDADRMEGVRGVRPRKGVFARPAAAADEIVGQIAAGDTRGPAWLSPNPPKGCVGAGYAREEKRG